MCASSGTLDLAPLVANADAALHFERFEEHRFPVVVPDRRLRVPASERAWVTCLWSASFGYPVEEGLGRWGRRLGSLPPFGPWARAIQPGSLPFSTTLRTADQSARLPRFAAALREARPDRAVGVRHVVGAEGRDAFRDHGFRLLPARVVYVLDPDAASAASHAKRDRSLFRRACDRILGDADFDAARIPEALGLYDLIYRRRHSLRNADYRADFIALARQEGLLELTGLACPSTGRLLAFAGIHAVDGTMSVPMLGFDPEDDAKAGHYRRLVAHLVGIARDRNLAFNFSSGAGDFKRRRGFRPILEWTAVAPALGARRHVEQAAWLMLAACATRGLDAERLIALGA